MKPITVDEDMFDRMRAEIERLNVRIAELEAELQRVRMNSVRPAHRRANSGVENNE